jgi:hypothetical protein
LIEPISAKLVEEEENEAKAADPSDPTLFG